MLSNCFFLRRIYYIFEISFTLTCSSVWRSGLAQSRFLWVSHFSSLMFIIHTISLTWIIPDCARHRDCSSFYTRARALRGIQGRKLEPEQSGQVQLKLV